ncbi:MAG TPA: hypothetical protein VK659_19810, partial [Asanoa sp.]|nr:hypothetical protein [Asanoa sp.]
MLFGFSLVRKWAKPPFSPRKTDWRAGPRGRQDDGMRDEATVDEFLTVAAELLAIPSTADRPD